MNPIKIRESRKELSKKITEFNSLIKNHIFVFELEEPSFKELHESQRKDTLFYNLAVSLGPSYVVKYFNFLKEKINKK